MPNAAEIRFPETIAEATELLANGTNGYVPMAGATWLMRAGLRKEDMPAKLLSLSKIVQLKEIARKPDYLALGALVTHEVLADHLVDDRRFQGLASAGGQSANPGIRRLATLGGNICTQDFAASDIVPAMLAVDAMLELSGNDELLPLEAFLKTRHKRPAGELLLRLMLPDSERFSAHARLTMRAAGDYPVAIVSVSSAIDVRGRLSDVRLAVGSVEHVARRWIELERDLMDQELDPERFSQLAQSHLSDFTGRDAVDAKGSYRVRVLPYLIRRAFKDIAAQYERRVA